MPVKPLRTIEEGWQSLSKAAGIDKMGGVQQQEMRRAFVAGVAFALSECENIGASDDIDEQAGANHLEMLKTECMMFSAMIGRVPGF